MSTFGTWYEFVAQCSFCCFNGLTRSIDVHEWLVPYFSMFSSFF